MRPQKKILKNIHRRQSDWSAMQTKLSSDKMKAYKRPGSMKRKKG